MAKIPVFFVPEFGITSKWNIFGCAKNESNFSTKRKKSGNGSVATKKNPKQQVKRSDRKKGQEAACAAIGDRCA